MKLLLLSLILTACGTNDGDELEAEKRENFTAQIVTVDVDVEREEKTVLDYSADTVEEFKKKEETVTVTFTPYFTEPTLQVSRFNWAFVVHVVGEGEEPDCEDKDAKIITKGADMSAEYDDLEEGTYESAACLLDLNRGEYHEPVYTSFEI